MTQTYQVNEIFDSVQGEGVHAGMACTFIRLQGCTVGCPWCDTKYTWKKGGTRMSVEEIVLKVRYSTVVVTGGEPTMYNLDELFGALWHEKIDIHLESSGQNAFKGQYAPNWLTWSPKRNLNFDAPEEFKRCVNEIKFVVDEDLSMDDVCRTERWFEDNYARMPQVQPYVFPRIVLMPEGCPPSEENMQHAFTWVMMNPRWHFSDRLQYRIGVK
jgi:7-carboxy-7-deazaguanine synthase